MKTPFEKSIDYMDDKTLINMLYAHLDRGQYRANDAGRKTLEQIFHSAVSEGEKDELKSILYNTVLLTEDMLAIKFATKNLHKRLLRYKRQVHNMRVQFEKIRGERAPIIEKVEMPDLWNVGDDDE